MTFQALLFCPDERTARVTTQILNELEFSVEACNEPFIAVKKLMGQHFDAIVVDCENEQNASLLFKSARNSASNQGSLAVAVVEGQAGVANAFRVGANLVLTKPINVEQAKSTLRVARGLLRKGSDAKTTAAPAATQAATPAPKPAIPAPKASPAPVSAVVKPSLPVTHKPRPETALASAKPSLDGEDLLETADQAPSASQPTDESLFESPEEQAPATPLSSSKPVASREYPWQPISKPAGAIASSPKRTLETAGKSAVSAAATPAPKTAPMGVAPDQVPHTAPVRAQGGAASAPAPAREVPRISSPKFAGLGAASQHPATDVVEPPEPLSAPSFAALSLPDDEGGSEGGSKKPILIVVLVIALGAAAYFGYTKLMGSKQAHPNATAPSQQSAAPSEAAPQPEEITVGGTASAGHSPQQANIEATPGRASGPAKSPTRPAASSSAPAEASSDEPEVTVTHPDAPKLVVKSDVGPRVPRGHAAPVEAVAPPVLSNLGGEDSSSAITALVKSAPVSVPKAAAPPEVIKVSQGVTQGMILKRVQPTYPQQALQMRVHGSVLLQATISKTGNTTSVKVLSGDAVLARAAVQAVSQWKYKPYYLNGEPVEIQTQITVNFKLPNE
jgi:periplasmic protein TonB